MSLIHPLSTGHNKNIMSLGTYYFYIFVLIFVNFDLVNIRDKNKKVSDDKNEEKDKSLTDNVSVKCPHCNDLFTNNTGITKHMKSHYSSLTEENVCSPCSERFIKATGMTKHMKSHHIDGAIIQAVRSSHKKL